MAEHEIDWDEAFEQRFSKEPPPTWWPNQKLKPISIKGVGLFAIDPETNALYWNGHQLETVKRLDEPERVMAGIATGSAAIVALLELVKFVTAFV